MSGPVNGVAFTFTVSLLRVSTPGFFYVNPPLATGDFKISKDNGAYANLTTLPTISPTADTDVLISLSATEMTVTTALKVRASDPDGLWADATWYIEPDSVAIDTSLSAVKTKTDFLPSVTAGAAGGVFIAGTNAATTVTTALTTTFTGNLTGNVNGSVGSLAAQAKADVNAEADTALADVGLTSIVTGRIDAAMTTRASQTSVDDLPTNAELATALAGADDAVLAAIAALNNLAAGAAMTLTTGERNAIAAALLDLVDGIEAGLTVRQALRLGAAADAGKVAGMATSLVTIRNAIADTKVRISATVDTVGNRTAITTDVS